MRIVLSVNFCETYNRFGMQDCAINILEGFSRLGHEVFVFEEVQAKHCFDSRYQPVPFEKWRGREHFEGLMRSLDRWSHSSLIYNGGESTHGLDLPTVIGIAKTADVLLNFAGRLKIPEIVERIPCRAYIDRNPGTEQVYNAVYGIDYGFDQHHYFFTHGLNIGRPGCEIPTCGRLWIGTLVPVVLDLWPPVEGSSGRFTTITGWGNRETFDLRGRYSGDKIDEWMSFVALPARTNQHLEIALEFDPDYARDHALLESNGWRLVDTTTFRDITDYRNYITSSRAELAVAHAPYVRFRLACSGDRMTRYAASGRPVLIQSTGLEEYIPTGKGFLTFSTIDEAVESIAAVTKDYPTHSRAARAIAEEYFDSGKVLTKMLRQMGF
jgi:hypothetical protein